MHRTQDIYLKGWKEAQREEMVYVDEKLLPLCFKIGHSVFRFWSFLCDISRHCPSTKSYQVIELKNLNRYNNWFVNISIFNVQKI